MLSDRYIIHHSLHIIKFIAMSGISKKDVVEQIYLPQNIGVCTMQVLFGDEGPTGGYGKLHKKHTVVHVPKRLSTLLSLSLYFPSLPLRMLHAIDY